jgi:hypothetical protein
MPRPFLHIHNSNSVTRDRHQPPKLHNGISEPSSLEQKPFTDARQERQEPLRMHPVKTAIGE